MEWLFIIGLVVAVMTLLKRLKTLERRIEEVDSYQAFLLQELRRGPVSAPVSQPTTPEPEREPDPAVRVRVSVPKAVTIPRGEDAVETQPLEPVAGPATTPPEPEHQNTAPEPARSRFDLEDIFGRRLPIWAGGVTLAVAGMFLVRYSIEHGLITPLLRVVMAFVFGFGLLAGAEAAYRFRDRVADPRVGQALAGAGLATLYAAFYLAGTQYGLIGQMLAFLGLAAVTAGAIALSFRFGLPSAVLGLVGGFAAPAMIEGEQANLPLLSLYLGSVTAGLVLSGRRQQRPWLGVTALVGGLGWGAFLLLAGEFGFLEVIAFGLYLVLLGAVLPAVASGPAFERPLRLGAAAVASAQLALLVDEGGYSPLTWALYLLLGATLAFFGWRRPDIRHASGIALGVALLLLTQWDGVTRPEFAVVAAGIAVVFAGVPLALMRRGEGRAVDGWQIAGTALGLATIAYTRFGDPGADRVENTMALALLALAALPGTAAWLLRATDDAPRLALQLAASAALVFAALLLVTPAWSAPLAGAAVFAALLTLVRGRREIAATSLLWGGALAVMLTLIAFARFDLELAHLGGWRQDSRSTLALLRWLGPAGVFAALAGRERIGDLRRLADAAAAVFAYGMLAQVLPRDALAWTAALLAIGLHFSLRDRVAARLTALGIAAAWALEPLAWWLGAGLASLAADPVLVSDLPALTVLVARILPVLAALAVVRIPLPEPRRWRLPAGALALAVAIIVAHILYKQLFAIGDTARFVALGLAERTLWEALLLGAAWLAASGLPRLGQQRPAAIALAGAAFAHFALYTAYLHNPLWDRQALGTLPLLNLAGVAYAVAIATMLSLRRWATPRLAPVFDGAVMASACLALLTLLRQGFAGSLPTPVPLSQGEDLLRSLAGIMLALAFLWLGGRRGERSWRLGSLAIMVVAVAKVFLVDAAGLDGLLRVASFMALGFSLIGIGWVYSRQLRARPADA